MKALHTKPIKRSFIFLTLNDIIIVKRRAHEKRVKMTDGDHLTDNNYLTYNGIVIEDHALFEITKKCNYSCKHCFTFGGSYRLPNELSTQEVISAARQFQKLGIKDITFSGGDPATRPDLAEIVKGTKRLGITPHIFSTLLSEDQLDELKKYVGVFALSLDGPEDVHDEIRRHVGAYKDSIRLLGLLKERKLNYFVQSMVTPASIIYMDWLVEICREYKVKGLRLSHASPLGRNLYSQGLYLSTKQIECLWSKSRQDFGKGAPKIFTNLVEKGYFLKNRTMYNALILHLLSDGDVVPMLGAGRSWKAGSVRKDPLTSMLAPANPGLSRFRDILARTYDQCEGRALDKWDRDWVPFEDVLALNLLGPGYKKNKELNESFLSEFLPGLAPH